MELLDGKGRVVKQRRIKAKVYGKITKIISIWSILMKL